METGNGICPHCETQRGELAALCSGELCAKKGYHYVSARGYKKAKEEARAMQRPLDPFLGRAIDKYVLVGKLGEGGMGAVFIALQKPLMREVALKIISGVAINEMVTARFEREARAISFLDHPNIVNLFDFGIGDGDIQVPYMALEYVRDGITLRDLWQKLRSTGQQLTFSSVVHVFTQILNALDEAHQRGIVHRDIKPENIMVKEVAGDPFFIKLLDFGLAKALEEFQGFEATLSQVGSIMGTPYYMAPEQILVDPNKSIDGRADLYAVGVVMAEALLGERPYDGDTIKEILGQKLDPGFHPMDRPSAQALPEAARAFLERSMARDPDARFADAASMKKAMVVALAHQSEDAFQEAATSMYQALEPRPVVTPAASLSTPRAAVSTPGQPIMTAAGVYVPTPQEFGSAPSDPGDLYESIEPTGKGRWVIAVVLFLVGALALVSALVIPRVLEKRDAGADESVASADKGGAAGDPGTSAALGPATVARKAADVSSPGEAEIAAAKEATAAGAKDDAKDGAGNNDVDKAVAAADPSKREEVSIEPDVQKEPEDVAPALPPVAVTLRTKPEGAIVFVDEKPVGLSPVVFTVSSERQSTPDALVQVKMQKDGYVEGRHEVSVKDLVDAKSLTLNLQATPKRKKKPRPSVKKPSPRKAPVKPKPEKKKDELEML